MDNTIKTAIGQLLNGCNLTAEMMTGIMKDLMAGHGTPAQIGGFLVAMTLKGETVEEITAAATMVRQAARRVTINHPNLVDVVGTGGDASHTFNISTASGLVAAAGGARVAKHGNRSASSKSGSADVLEAAGVHLDLTPEQATQCIETVGIGFLFAPAFHQSWIHTVGPRKELGIRTLFNLLGPLSNPAGAPNQCLGVFSEKWLEPLARVLHNLGSRHVLVVHGLEGLDEISLQGPTRIAELKDNQIKTYTINPGDFGLSPAPLSTIQVDGPNQSLAMIENILSGKPGPGADIVALNAGATLYCAGIADNLNDGVQKARQILEQGAARPVLERLVRFTQDPGFKATQ